MFNLKTQLFKWYDPASLLAYAFMTAMVLALSLMNAIVFMIINETTIYIISSSVIWFILGVPFTFVVYTKRSKLV